MSGIVKFPVKFNVGLIIQARMSSKRFPGKSVATLHGHPIIARVVLGCMNSAVDKIVVAIPAGEQQDPIADVIDDYFIDTKKITYSRYAGLENDVLGRYNKVAEEFNFTHIIRVTADCPYIEASPINDVVKCMKDNPEIDYVSNCWPTRTLPKGLDCEGFTRKKLVQAQAMAKDKYDREHVTPWMQRNSTALKNIVYDLDSSSTNLCVDYPTDIQRLETLYGETKH